jgi:hypothetical protein
MDLSKMVVATSPEKFVIILLFSSITAPDNLTFRKRFKIIYQLPQHQTHFCEYNFKVEDHKH